MSPTPGKTVKSITLPNDSGIKVFAITGGGVSAAPVNTVVLETNGALVEYVNGVGSPQPLSGAGAIRAVSTVLDVHGQTVVVAITTGINGAQYNNTLWEYTFGVWSEQSSGSFQQVSAATNAGGDADVTILDPTAEWTIDPSKFRSKSRNCPWAGQKVRGRAETVLVGGVVKFERTTI
jgi:hypothetical protein